MKKLVMRLLLLELLVFFAVILSAQTPDAFTPTEKENRLLWEISGNGLELPSYLYGTIHMIPTEHFFLTDATKAAFDVSTRIAFEIDTKEMTDPSSLMGLMSKIYMNNDTTLSDLLSDEDYQVVAKHFEGMGMPMMFMGKIKPMFLSVLASEDMKDMKSGDNPLAMMSGEGMRSYELVLTDRADSDDKPIVGLETAEFQMSLFDSIPYTAQAQMLLEAVKSESDTTGGDGALEKMIDLYTTQDIVGMQSLMSDDPGGIGGYEDILLLKRNRNWIPVMEGLMKEESVFFAVGAGHLAGEEGVIALLRRAGYTMKPLD